MTATTDFEKGFKRVQGLIAHHRSLTQQKGRPQAHASDVLRATLVLAVATLDGFVRERVLEIVPTALGSFRIDREGVTKYVEEFYREIASAKDPNTRRLDLIRAKIGKASSHDVPGIEAHVALVGRQKSAFWESVQKEVEAGIPGVNVKERLSRIALRRHQIVHRGDIEPKTGKTASITRAWVESETDFLLSLGRAIERDLKSHRTTL